jgi:hypothetical protein
MHRFVVDGGGKLAREDGAVAGQIAPPFVLVRLASAVIASRSIAISLSAACKAPSAAAAAGRKSLALRRFRRRQASVRHLPVLGLAFGLALGTLRQLAGQTAQTVGSALSGCSDFCRGRGAAQVRA